MTIHQKAIADILDCATAFGMDCLSCSDASGDLKCTGEFSIQLFCNLHQRGSVFGLAYCLSV